jgi:hypothetical protein
MKETLQVLARHANTRKIIFDYLTVAIGKMNGVKVISVQGNCFNFSIDDISFMIISKHMSEYTQFTTYVNRKSPIDTKDDYEMINGLVFDSKTGDKCSFRTNPSLEVVPFISFISGEYIPKLLNFFIYMNDEEKWPSVC